MATKTTKDSKLTSPPPLDTVVGWVESQLFASKDFPRYNPDELVGRKGLSVYDKMMLDEQVKAVVRFKRDAIASREHVFRFDESVDLSDEEKQRRITLFNHAMRSMRGSFQDALSYILRGMYHGFSLTEKVYTDVEFEGRTYIGLAQLLPRPADTFAFYADDYGQLRRFEQQVAGKRQFLDISKFVHYVHNPENDQFYGRSELREAYRSWYAKDVTIKYWLLYLERFAGGFAVAKRGPNSALRAGSPEYAALQNIVQNLRSMTGVIMPPDIDLEVVPPTNTDQYERAISFHNLAIAKSLLVPNLLGLSETGQTGAYAQSQTQLEAFFWTLNADTRRLCACLNEQLFRDLGDLNFGDGLYPQFTFAQASVEHVKWVVATWKDLVGAKAVKTTYEDEVHLRKVLDMPAREEEAEGLFEAEEAERREEEMQARADALKAQGKPKLKAVMTRNEQAIAKATRRVAFAVLDHKIEHAVDASAERLSDTTARAVARLITDDMLAQLLDHDMSDIETIRFDAADMSKLKAASKQALEQGWQIGAAHAVNELAQARQSAEFKSLRRVAAQYIEANGYRMAANVADGTRAILQQELINAVKAGLSPAQTRANIYGRLAGRGFIAGRSLRALEKDPVVLELLRDVFNLFDGNGEPVSAAQALAYVKTLVRTNISEAMNEARFAEFTDPALDGFVVAFRYSAILDGRTTEICNALHGGEWRSDNPMWNAYRPPNHYNCRSVLIPITEMDGWDGEEDPPPTVSPQAGFGGSA